MKVKEHLSAVHRRLDRMAQSLGDLLHHFVKAQNLDSQISPLFTQPPEVLISRAGFALEALHQQLDMFEMYLVNIKNQLHKQQGSQSREEAEADSLIDTAEDLPPSLNLQQGADAINWAAMDSWLDLDL